MGVVHFVFLSSSAGCLQRGACMQASASACMCPEVEISERPERRPDSTFYILMGQDTLREERVPHPAGRHLGGENRRSTRGDDLGDNSIGATRSL